MNENIVMIFAILYAIYGIILMIIASTQKDGTRFHRNKKMTTQYGRYLERKRNRKKYARR